MIRLLKLLQPGTTIAFGGLLRFLLVVLLLLRLGLRLLLLLPVPPQPRTGMGLWFVKGVQIPVAQKTYLLKELSMGSSLN